MQTVHVGVRQMPQYDRSVVDDRQDHLFEYRQYVSTVNPLRGHGYGYS